MPFLRGPELLMRTLTAVLMTLLATSVSVLGAERSGQPLDFGPWRYLAVQDGGRRKPLDTLARETAWMLSHRTRFTDPETARGLDSVALYLAMLFDWEGWDKSPDAQAPSAMRAQPGYFDLYEADKWDQAPLIRVGSLPLRKALGLDERRGSFSPFEISKASVKDPVTRKKVTDPLTGKEIAFDRWAKQLVHGKQDGFTEFESEALEVANRVWLYQKHRTGERLYVLPEKDSPDQHWISVAELMRSDFDGRTDAAGLREASEGLERARAAYVAGSPEAFRQASHAFIAAVRRIGPKLGPYPGRTTIDLEVVYNRWSLFSLAWVLSLAALVCLLVGMAARWQGFSTAGLALFAASLAVMLIGFALRAAISGRVPVTNLYESVVFAAFGAMGFGLVFGLLARKQYVFAASAAVATLALVLADYSPSVLDPRIRPLMPVLRSNFWLAVHVITIMLSYAAFALTLAIGNITLAYYLTGSTSREAINARARLTYKTLQAGVLLLVVGTILGALWADYSWGRFWGWDPKEVWALITLLGYLAVLHARCTGWIGNRGLTAWSVICFCLVVITWYMANMLPGLHEYGLGGGGQYYVWGAMGLQLLYVVAAVVRSAAGDLIPAREPSSAAS